LIFALMTVDMRPLMPATKASLPSGFALERLAYPCRAKPA
jgi:hypothetical protein